jgi:predicted RNA binding protein YcfA (HicA-like mRNA interferase family)
MSNLPALTSKDVIRLLYQHGFILDRTRGSHQIFLNPASRKRVVVPMHNKSLPIGTLLAILKQAGIKREEI